MYIIVQWTYKTRDYHISYIVNNELILPRYAILTLGTLVESTDAIADHRLLGRVGGGVSGWSLRGDVPMLMRAGSLPRRTIKPHPAHTNTNLNRFLFINNIRKTKKQQQYNVNFTNWCNMTFTAGNLFPSHSCIGVTRVVSPLRYEPGPQHERWTT